MVTTIVISTIWVGITIKILKKQVMKAIVFCVVVSVLTQFDGQQYYVCKTNNNSVGKVYTPIHYEVGDTIWIECR